MSRIVAIIQARYASERLPGKVMMPIVGKPMLWHVWQRTKRAGTIDHVIVATGSHVDDDRIVDFCNENSIAYYRGSTNNVLDRYYQAAKAAKASIILRITADCPLIDSVIIDDVVTYFLRGEYDYVSNVNPPTYPDGQDIEVFTFSALERAWRDAHFRSEREHVTPYIVNHPELFRLGNVVNDVDLSAYRWTVDTEADMEFVRSVFEGLQRVDFGMDDVLSLLNRKPELAEINKGQVRNAGYKKSLKEDSL